MIHLHSSFSKTIFFKDFFVQKESKSLNCMILEGKGNLTYLGNCMDYSWNLLFLVYPFLVLFFFLFFFLSVRDGDCKSNYVQLVNHLSYFLLTIVVNDGKEFLILF